MNGKVKNAMAALLLVAAPLATQAKQWSLKDCIDYALANNIALQKTQLTKASAQRRLSAVERLLCFRRSAPAPTKA